ncbi:hypothetical protein quinque_016416 [Culex quinquefasciatus]
MELNPVPVLMSMVIYSERRKYSTPEVGDPLTVIIAPTATSPRIRMKFKTINDLRFTGAPGRRRSVTKLPCGSSAAASLFLVPKDEDLVRETLLVAVNRLSRSLLKKKLVSGSVPVESHAATLELKSKYPIRNYALLVKSAVTNRVRDHLLLFLQASAPDIQKLPLGC